ncbi:MAG TPA: hypothetical protein P5531_14505 [Bacteroidales bacterium]|nr:hypothetical protein [Bacteroidales bacterium]HSA44815.1 hypothetical protein [Bacteroidales bacterium]
MRIEELPEYGKDIKRLHKKYHTLTSDLDVLLKILSVLPDARPPFSFRIDGLGIRTTVIKVKRISSDCFKGKGNQSGFRLVYAYIPDEQRIVLIEIYHKNTKDIEDRNRILRNFQ